MLNKMKKENLKVLGSYIFTEFPNKETVLVYAEHVHFY